MVLFSSYATASSNNDKPWASTQYTVKVPPQGHSFLTDIYIPSRHQHQHSQGSEMPLHAVNKWILGNFLPSLWNVYETGVKTNNIWKVGTASKRCFKQPTQMSGLIEAFKWGNKLWWRFLSLS